ncbi:MAG: carbon-nitrogen hydrolase family protein [Campylobacter sp.]|nr:carbon-nitrogen hydrolase family protein [Campylobacter sp.]
MRNLKLIPLILQDSDAKMRLNSAIKAVRNAESNSLLLASELCFNAYDTSDFAFGDFAINSLKNELGMDKFFGFTHLRPAKNGKFYNEFSLFNGEKTFHTQNKIKLFLPNKEDEIFMAGDKKELRIFELNGLKIGVLICFELRFVKFWAKLKSCDIILVPALWGKTRQDDLLTLCKALALINHCYVLVSSALDLNFAAVFLPNGKCQEQAIFDKKLISKTRKKLGLG